MRQCIKNLLLEYSRQQVIKSTPSEPEDAVIGNFDFLQREGNEEGEQEIDDGGNADDELDERDVEMNRLQLKRGKQGIFRYCFQNIA